MSFKNPLHLFDSFHFGSKNIGGTRMFFAPVTVEPIVIHDGRPVDGDLELQLTPEIKLSVNGGFNPVGTIEYSVMVKQEGILGGRRIPLIPNITFQLGR